jgi:hypothetical protein
MNEIIFYDRADFHPETLEADSPGVARSRIIADDIPIINNICANNEATGINVKICPGDCPVNRDYNLLSANFGWDANPGCSGPLWESNPCRRQQLTGCEPNSNEMFQDPLFVDKANDNYRLHTDSPAKNAGDDGTDMGAYGGSDPINP